MANILKAVKKINRKPLKHARRQDILEEKFEGLEGPIDTQHLLISTLLPPAISAALRNSTFRVIGWGLLPWFDFYVPVRSSK